MPMIEVKALVKTYSGPVEALRGIDLRVEKGQIYALLGPNGAGKSSTMRILASLSQPTAGRVKLAGHDVFGPDEYSGQGHRGAEAARTALRRDMGYVAQASTSDETLTGRENLRMQGRLFGMGGDDLARHVAHLLKLFDLDEAADRRTKGWSGGMRRRLDLAMGLIHGPQILILDEPSAGLDPQSRAVMWREIRHLAQDQGMTILFSTHYLEEADQLADRVAIIDQGRIVAEGSPKALKDRLEGDLISIRFATAPDPQDLAERLAKAGLPTDHASADAVPAALGPDQDRLDLRVAQGSSILPLLIGALDGLPLLDVSMARPRLDDVYLQVTGRRFKAADGDREAKSSAASPDIADHSAPQDETVS
ncbi:daunorubicin resistance protein DrrA family ABC transporter ATP-binding protein [Iodidimonas nitroreducens]|uniref:Daunorubicin resistance protein DrrA family ABC transporter ATP-binding protein n=2 Tax=Iodidimonas nitroreducens TaxID=1236968 RepID=A0A5A7N6R1_9PROT|nr:daunorubicin/doxorubicin resistance ATP-binding protein DrrA [alpha proteobacterium Q-1]GER03677.1 daunorubicin resistance protein DrrA family ABC transporter ATP-binding protein [Iodidimonas nitroreducens]